MSSGVKLALLCGVTLGGAGYLSYQYSQIKAFEDEIYKHSKQKRAFMFNIHQKLAFKFDQMMDDYEKFTKIPQYRKIACSYMEGFVLESGVGSSRNQKFYPSGARVLGIDWASNILEAAFQKSHGTDVQMEYKIDDCEKMSFKDNVFDSAIDTFGMEYYVNPEKVIKELKRVVKPGGTIAILASGAGHYDLLNLYQNYKTPYTVCNHGFFPNRQWDELITENDFTIEKFERKMSGSIYLFILKNNKK